MNKGFLEKYGKQMLLLVAFAVFVTMTLFMAKVWKRDMRFEVPEDKKYHGIDVSNPVTITLCLPSSNIYGKNPDAIQEVLDSINAILTERMNASITVTPLSFYGNWKMEYNQMISNDVECDIIFTSKEIFDNVSSRDVYLPLEELLPVYAPYIWEKQNQKNWDIASYNGAILAIPALMRMYNPYVVLYRKDLQEKYGCPPVTDIESLEKYMELVQQKEKDIIPFAVSADESQFLMEFMTAVCGWQSVDSSQSLAYIQADQQDITNVFNFADTKEFMRFCKLIRAWNEKGYLGDSLLSKVAWSRDSYARGESAAGIFMIGDLDGTIMDYQLGSDVTFRTGMLDFPTITGGIFHYTNGLEDACAILKKSKNPERALMVYNELVSDEELYRLLHYGLEGVHYEINENGKLEFKKDQTGDFIYEEDCLSTWAFRNPEYYLMHEQGSEEVLDLFRYYDEIATEDRLEGFSLDVSDITNTMEAIETVNIQWLYPLFVGEYENVEDAVEEYRDQLNNAGAQEMIQNIKDQIIAFCNETYD